MERYKNKVEIIKVWLAVGLIIFGCCLLVAGFIVAPLGLIDQSVLIAFGEIATFSGSVLGINAIYQSRVDKIRKELLDTKENKING